MHRLLLLVCFVSVLTLVNGQREYVGSAKMCFSVKDAGFLDSYDGAIKPNLKPGHWPFVYKWTGPDNFLSTDSVLVNIKPGTYIVHMNDGKCRFITDTIHVATRSNTYQNQKSFVVVNVHPNPFTEYADILFRSSTAQTVQLEIFYSNGQVYGRKQINLDEGETIVKLDLASAPAGIYVLNFCNSSNCKMTERIIKLN